MAILVDPDGVLWGRDQENLVHSVNECSETHTEPEWGINDECPGADFTNGLKSDFGLKFKTLVLNSVKNVLSQRA